MTAPDARAIAHQAIGCECKLLAGKHDEICDRVTAALRAARNEALEEALATVKQLMKHLWTKQAVLLWTELEELDSDIDAFLARDKDRP